MCLVQLMALIYKCIKWSFGNNIKKKMFGSFYVFSNIFILLSRESDQCAIRARLGVTGHLSTTPRWGNPAKCFSNGTTNKLAGLFSALSI